MNDVRLVSAVAFSVIFLAACVALAPGADKVRMTKNASDVSACAAVGNIRVPRNSQGQADTWNGDAELRNQAVGLGGNTVFVTAGLLAAVEGIAYRCP